MREQKYQAKDKKVSKMSRDGLTEQNLATGDTRKVTGRESEAVFKKSEEELSFGRSGENPQRKQDHARAPDMQNQMNPDTAQTEQGSGQTEEKQSQEQYQDHSSRVREVHESATSIRERKASHHHHYHNQRQVKASRLQFDKMETDGSLGKHAKSETADASMDAEPDFLKTSEKKAQKAQEKLQHARKKQMRKTSLKMQQVRQEDVEAVKTRLHFEGTPPTGKVGTRIRDSAGNLLHNKIRKEEQDNVAVQSIHQSEQAGESLLRVHSNLKYHGQRKQQSYINRLEKKVYRANTKYQYQKYLAEHPELKHKFVNRMIQKQRIKREYRKAYQAGRAGGETATRSAGVVYGTSRKIARKLGEIFGRNKAALVSLGALGMLLVFVLTSFSSCSMMFTQGMANILAVSYLADPDEIEQAELYYTELEAKLQQNINSMESRYAGKDEYRYNLASIGHDPHTLISYLTAKYGDFTFSQVKSEIDALFEAQYGVKVEETTDTVTKTETIQVGESLGTVVTSGYCNCSICCGIWSGGPTASGVMPTANHTIAVDASNPFLPMGTKVVMNGVEYTVEDTGAFDRYGVQFDVYYDNHAAASAHGHQRWECYLAEGNANSVEVTRTVTIEVLNVTLTAKPLSSLVRARLGGEEEELYKMIYSVRGNLQEYETPIELNWYAYISIPYGYLIDPGSGAMVLHKGVEINTKAGQEVQSSMDGTVVSTGYDNSFGNYVVTRDKKGRKIKYAHLQNVSVSQGDAVTKDTVIGTTASAETVTGGRLYLELMDGDTYYNPVFYLETGEGGLYGGGASYDDETVQRLFEEAEKYLGMPYVWGGSSPETSFDCSGFVSYVFTNSGIYNMGRLTAQGIHDICEPISPEEARPGDIIFFTGTYATSDPVTHVGIYAGDGMMIHCGDPIQYASINSSYWQSHFYSFGRLLN
ncbi:MAG: NlpC/P60 family protein [Lachnospiraceae bacterium]|nr:NlpC/P60 family protein [Lachnospiraceae bacterium]